jgi:hypothetical protein
VDQRFSGSTGVHQTDEVLLRLCYLTLRGLLLGVLFRKVPADHAATDRTNDSVGAPRNAQRPRL